MEENKKKYEFFPSDPVVRKQRAKLGIKEGLIPFAIQFAILVVVILEFVFLVANEVFPNLSFVPIDESVGNNPNIMRFIYMFLTIPATIALVIWAVKSTNLKVSFWVALVAGIVAWQGIGECSWHFGVNVAVGTAKEVFVFFPKLEGPQGTFALLLFAPLMLYMFTKQNFVWGLKVFVLSFFCNWIGHWLILGIAPYFGVYELVWHKIAGFGIGGLGSLYLLYVLLFKAETTQERYIISLLLYTTVGMFVEGGFGVGASLE